MLQYVITVGDGDHFRRSVQHKVLYICWERERQVAYAAFYSFSLPVQQKVLALLAQDGPAAQAYFVHAVNLAVISSRVRVHL